jgi:hypothetical protein
LWLSGGIHRQHFFLLFLRFKEQVLHGDENQVSATQQFYNSPLQQIGGHRYSQNSKHH